MMNSSNADVINQVLERLVSFTDEMHLTHQIEEPIDRALASFHIPPGRIDSAVAFHRILSEFICHLTASIAGIKLSYDQAMTEGIDQLERLYRGPTSIGYAGALVDAMYTEGCGLEMVLMTLAQGLKQERRIQYLRFVFLREYESLDWTIRLSIASRLLQELKPTLGLGFSKIDPAQLVPQVPSLILNRRAVDRQLDQLLRTVGGEKYSF
jgi:hypothetical protein